MEIYIHLCSATLQSRYKIAVNVQKRATLSFKLITKKQKLRLSCLIVLNCLRDYSILRPKLEISMSTTCDEQCQLFNTFRSNSQTLVSKVSLSLPYFCALCFYPCEVASCVFPLNRISSYHFPDCWSILSYPE